MRIRITYYMDPDSVYGSGFWIRKFSIWIRIRIRIPDPDPRKKHIISIFFTNSGFKKVVKNITYLKVGCFIGTRYEIG